MADLIIPPTVEEERTRSRVTVSQQPMANTPHQTYPPRAAPSGGQLPCAL